MKKLDKMSKKPLLMKVTHVHVPKQDYPLGDFPPDNREFQTLKKLLKRAGMKIPVFVDQDAVVIQGHYRLWAWQELGHKHVPVVVINRDDGMDVHEKILTYFN